MPNQSKSSSPFFRDCAEMHIGLWECPSFLFLVLGVLNIASMLGTYFVTRQYDIEPELVALISVIVAAIFLTVSYVIVNAFSKAAEANRVKTEFVGIASHQLRTPLTNIKFALEYLASPQHGALSFNEKQETQFTIMQQSTERLLKLVSNLLDLSRIEEGRLVLERSPLDLKAVNESLLSELEPLIAARKLKLHLEVSPSVPPVSGDPSRVRMVVQNMLDNAIKYNSEGGDLWVRVEASKNNVAWSVADTGMGIPKSEQKRVFQKFYRASNVTLDHSYGSGLGLHIAKVIVEELGGQVGFHSKEREGSTFWFRLPVWKG